MGRDQGIRLSGINPDRPAVAFAMHRAGFSREQQHVIWSSLHETKPLESYPRAVPPRIWLRVWTRLAILLKRATPNFTLDNE